MVANVPCDVTPGANGRWYATNIHINNDTYGVGADKDVARASFYAALLERYQDLTISELHGTLTLNEARELEYLRNCREADAESGRDGGT